MVIHTECLAVNKGVIDRGEMRAHESTYPQMNDTCFELLAIVVKPFDRVGQQAQMVWM